MRLRALALAIGLWAALVAPAAWAHSTRALDREASATTSVETPRVAVIPSPGTGETPAPPPAEATPLVAGLAIWGWWVTGLLSAAAAALTLHRRRPSYRAVGLACAGLFAFFIVGSSPHLVHHLLDADKGAGCPVFQTVERGQLTLEAPLVLPPPAETSCAPTTSTMRAPSLPAPTPRGRAPPA